MGREIVNQVQEAQGVQYRINPKRNMLRHILIKVSKIKYKEKNIKSSKILFDPPPREMEIKTKINK